MTSLARPIIKHTTVIIPAHDEELVLGATLHSLASQDYPPSQFDVVVIADNCTDETAFIARNHGVTVMERTDLVRRGKGYALEWAFSQLLARDKPSDAFVIIDADTWVAPDFLSRMTASLTARQDDHGMCALQGRYGVLNPDAGWRASLMAGSFDLFNHVKPLGRDHLGLGTGLKGNGMAFTRTTLQAARWSGDSVTEDLDFGLSLIRDHHVKVGYVPDARVLAQMPSDSKAAATQRTRWEVGRYRLMKERAFPLIREGLSRRDVALWDAGLDLLLPPLAELFVLLFTWAALIAVGAWTGLLHHAGAWAAAAGLCAAGLGIYVIGGFALSGAPASAYLALLFAPFYTFWKIQLYAMRLLRRGKKTTVKDEPKVDDWVRTARVAITMPENISIKVPESVGQTTSESLKR